MAVDGIYIFKVDQKYIEYDISYFLVNESVGILKPCEQYRGCVTHAMYMCLR